MNAELKAELLTVYPIDDATRGLIAEAKYDLWYGPPGDADETGYPGFETACDTIRDALRDVGEVWVDTATDCVCEREPDWYTCHECGEASDNCTCDDGPTCDYPEDWVHYSRNDVIVELVGKDLAPYVR